MVFCSVCRNYQKVWCCLTVSVRELQVLLLDHSLYTKLISYLFNFIRSWLHTNSTLYKADLIQRSELYAFFSVLKIYFALKTAALLSPAFEQISNYSDWTCFGLNSFPLLSHNTKSKKWPGKWGVLFLIQGTIRS